MRAVKFPETRIRQGRQTTRRSRVLKGGNSQQSGSCILLQTGVWLALLEPEPWTSPAKHSLSQPIWKLPTFRHCGNLPTSRVISSSAIITTNTWLFVTVTSINQSRRPIVPELNIT